MPQHPTLLSPDESAHVTCDLSPLMDGLPATKRQSTKALAHRFYEVRALPHNAPAPRSDSRSNSSKLSKSLSIAQLNWKPATSSPRTAFRDPETARAVD